MLGVVLCRNKPKIFEFGCQNKRRSIIPFEIDKSKIQIECSLVHFELPFPWLTRLKLKNQNNLPPLLWVKSAEHRRQQCNQSGKVLMNHLSIKAMVCLKATQCKCSSQNLLVLKNSVV